MVLATSILITADWIASNTDYFPLIELNDDDDLNIYPDRVNHAWEKLNFPDLWQPNKLKIDLFSETFGFEANAIQRAMLECASKNPGLIILEAQMGCGKTEAALATAQNIACNQGSGGVYFGLPTQATANGIFPRLKNWAEKQSEGDQHTLELIHGSSALNKLYQNMSNGQSGESIDGEGLYVHTWFEGRKTGLLADFVVATVDQFLMCALKRKHFMLRLLGLIGKVVVIDECHAYDAYMNQYFDRVLNWLGYYQTPVILLSATLPSARKKEMLQAYLKGKEMLQAYLEGKDKKESKKIPDLSNAYPQITYTVGNEVKQKSINQNDIEKIIQVKNISEDDLQAVLINRLPDGGCSGIITNTVKAAQELYDTLQKQFPDYRVILFHSRFTMADRAKIEDDLLKRIGKDSQPQDRDKLIVVGTQVLEQSLDIDFDILFTQLCPMDLLLQRIGRMHRHDRKRPECLSDPACYIFHPKDALYDKDSGKIYGDWLLTQTSKYLKDVLYFPKDIPSLVEKVYEDPNTEELNETEKTYYKWYIYKIEKKKSDAGHFRIDEVKNTTMKNLLGKEEAPSTVRDGVTSIEAIVLTNDSERKLSYDVVPTYEEALELQKKKIKLPNVFSQYHWEETINDLKEIDVWNNNPVLKGESYLILNDDGTCEIAGYRISYDQTKGLVYEKIGDSVDEERI